MKVKKGQLRKNFILNKKMSTNCIDKIFRYLDNTTCRSSLKFGSK